MRIVEITDINDDLLPVWLDLWEISFPPEEKVLVSYFINLLKDKVSGLRQHEHMLAILDDGNKLVGISHYCVYGDTNVGYLWYIAVNPELRGGGIGALIYKDVFERIRTEGASGMLFEVEFPDHMTTDAGRELAERRINFYKRQGAKLLTGVHYSQKAAPHQPVTPMHLMFHPIDQIDVQDAYDLAKRLFGDDLLQVGELSLE